MRLKRFSKAWKRKLEELEIIGGIDTIQTMKLMGSVRILKRDLLPLNPQGKTNGQKPYQKCTMTTTTTNNNNNNKKKKKKKKT